MATARVGSEAKPKRKTTLTRRAHVVKDDAGKPVVVVLPIAEYQALVERIEDLGDTIAVLEARLEGGEAIPWEEFEAQLRAEGKLP